MNPLRRAWLPGRAGVVILAYHRVGAGTGSPIDIGVDEFGDHVAWLADNANVVTLDAAVESLATRNDVASVAITFDDGCPDIIDNALPILAERGLPSTLFVATAFVDGSLPWGAPMTSWSALRDAMSTQSLMVESHSHRHLNFSRLDGRAARADLDASIASIEDHLGYRPQHFAFPKAVPPSVAAAIEVRRRFRSAVLARSRANHSPTDTMQLWRTPMLNSDRVGELAATCAGRGRLDGELRHRLARLRYRGSPQ